MRYVCQICGYVYDEPREKSPFAALPEDWKCPLCGAAKSQFRPDSPSAAPAVKTAPADIPELKKLTAGQMAAVCSNLARGCEKQYMTAEAGLFRELADWFTAVTPPVEDADARTVSRLLSEDIENYPSVRAAADDDGDGGAARVCVWGEKVSRMLSSLMSRYETEGEKMLEGQEVWLCTVCGFVYIGKEPPELCPVCKVPSWKFEKIEGRDGQ